MQEEVVASDPCQIPVVDKNSNQRRICGAVKKSLYAHLKAHKHANGKSWTAEEYKKKYKNFSLGQPQNRPSEEQKRKFLEASPHYQKAKEVHDQREAADQEQANDDEQKVEERFNEIWDQVNRDVAVKQFAKEAARCELRLEELNRRYDKKFRQADYKAMTELTAQITEQSKLLEKNMTFLDLSVKNRREKNQLGNDTVAQLVSNYGGTLKRMSPERRQIFANRINDVRIAMRQRIRDKQMKDLLSENISDEEAVPMKQTEADIDASIQDYIRKSGV